MSAKNITRKESEYASEDVILPERRGNESEMNKFCH
jgi:hypothetical protein